MDDKKELWNRLRTLREEYTKLATEFSRRAPRGDPKATKRFQEVVELMSKCEKEIMEED